MKQTAVEWLVSELKKYDSAGLKDQSNYVIEMPTHILTELEEQAKEMEKQQIIDACKKFSNLNGVDIEDYKQYYNQTFN
jgi:DnaJ-domain-containing protein 1